ncbi:cysteine hydrolase family protein [Paracraurococcus lichenis]|uniref:Isochorismatase family cysteine hydrolase n=1 Tax=Paracraurococcus lichenis TaxID=3064888 RepID=A0ABT9DSL9_9PROT|nr:isochorismatase family cysteine hydrolase [Paracraurococcus sp. LOR1-02]MDO9706891.1 isochorismatase family cysteine hydrolase [Paracraurococcus sp. LOR1-02]
MAGQGLQNGGLTESCVHLCVDMQNLFCRTDWHTPWLERVLPVVERIASAWPQRTIFTRFIPAERPGQGEGTWRRYWERWSSMTLEALPPEAIELLPPLRRLVPPAELLDKTVYSPWVGTDLQERLQRRRIDTLVVSGAETDVCVLAAVLGAVDRGYRVVVPTDALCSSSDTTHDALLTLYRERYGQQVETATAAEILEAWR